MSKMKIVIMAGGVGERFWPKSRKSLPKQFLNLAGDHTMIQDTVDRLLPIVSIDDIYIVTGEIYKDLIQEQLPSLPVQNIILEPSARNTAACIGLAAVHIQNQCGDSIMVVLPSDHVIKDEENFRDMLIKGSDVASDGPNIVTIGIVPTHPEVGYGYIKIDNDNKTDHVTKVERFVEKPDRMTAEAYLASGHYLWNSGMFMWSTSTFLNNMKVLMPNHYNCLKEIGSALNTSSYMDALVSKYSDLEKISVDHGILEHADNIYVMPGDFGWDDVGSWNSIERLNDVDYDNNVFKGEIKAIGTKNCTVEGNGRLISLVGLEDLIIVDTDDALLIAHKDSTNQIKDIVAELKKSNDYRI